MFGINKAQHHPGHMRPASQDRLEEWARDFRKQVERDHYSLNSEYTEYCEYPFGGGMNDLLSRQIRSLQRYELHVLLFC